MHEQNDFASAPLMYFHFSRDELIRPNRPPISLRRQIIMRMLEHLIRNGQMSIAEQQNLLRQKRAEMDRDPRPPANAFRQYLSQLCRLIEEWGIPIKIYRDGPLLGAHFDPMLLCSNVTDAELLVKEAAARLSYCHFDNAIELAGRALALDYDSTRAASLVAQLLHTGPDHLTAELVVRAEFCLGRGMLRDASAVQRLRNKTGLHPDLAQAMMMAESNLKHLQQQWLAFRSWPFDSSSQDRVGRDYRNAFREFLEFVIDARHGSRLEFDRITSNSLLMDIVEHLLAGRPTTTDTNRQNEVTRNLQLEILAKLISAAWQPSPVTSQQELCEQICSFLTQRRLDWGNIFGQSRTRTTEFRDDLYNTDDGDDDDE